MGDEVSSEEQAGGDPPGSARRRQLTLVATVLGSALAFIDATVVLVALPRIEQDLGLGLDGQQWVFLSYSLALASLYLVAGAVGDRWGRRDTFVFGIIGFAVASAVAGAAPSGEVLIVARVAQGAAGAFVTTNSLALLRATYGAEAGRAVGLWTALTGVALIAGPPLGGALVEWASWRWIFLINLPLAALAVIAARAGRSSERARERVGHLDVAGAALVAAGLGFLAFALVQGPESGFGELWWAFAVAALALVSFFVVEARASEPMLPLGLFRHRNFAVANAATFLVYAAIGGVFFFLNLYLQFLGFTPFEAGLVNLPVSVIMILLAARFGGLSDRHGPRAFLTVGPLAMAGGIVAFAWFDEKADLWTSGIVGLGLFSVGLAAVVAPITATALSAAPTELAGIASGVNQTLSRVGNVMAVAVLGVVVALIFDGAVDAAGGIPFEIGQDDPNGRQASIDAFRAVLIVAAGLLVVGSLVSALGISNQQALEDGRRAATDADAGDPEADELESSR